MDDDLRDGTSVTIQRSKTAAGRRTVPLVKEAQLIVAEQRMSRPAGCYLLFPSLTGRRWSKDNFNHRVFRPAVEAAGFGKRLTFHYLRHTFASLAIASGMPPSWSFRR